MRIVLMLIVFSVFSISIGFSRSTYYVSTVSGASDTNPGTLQSPFKTIAKGISVAVVGDSIVLRGGTYAITSPLLVNYVGNASNWTVITAYPGEIPLIDANDTPVKKKASSHITAPNSGDEGAFCIYDAKYIRIRNIKLKNSHNAGFNIRKSSNIQILDCSTEYTHSSGISAWYSHNILVSGNSVRKANTVSMDDNNDGKTGAHEAISFGSVEHFVIEGNEVYDGEKEGIDVKQACKYGVVRNNHAHDMQRQGIYVDGYPYYPSVLDALYLNENDSLKCIDVYQNISNNNSQGIIHGSEGGTPCDSVFIHHNIVYDNEKAGIHIASYFGNNGPLNRVEVYNNTLYDNSLMREYWWSDGGIFMETRNIRNAIVRNNLCVNNGDFQIGATRENLADDFIKIDYNLIVGEMVDFSLEKRLLKDNNADSAIYAQFGTFPILSNPFFVDSSNKNFYLQLGSPAINAGCPLAKYNDADGSRNDVGAFPYVSMNNLLTGKDLEVSIFPNPSSHTLYVEGIREQGAYTIYNTKGQIIQNGSNVNFINEGVDVSSLLTGLYLMTIKINNGNSISIHFIKK